VAFAAIPVSTADSGPIVTVTGGQVRGAMLDKGGAVFRGILYAQPPVSTDPVTKEGLRRPYRDLFMDNVERLMAK
jgi:hypothetical protein